MLSKIYYGLGISVISIYLLANFLSEVVPSGAPQKKALGNMRMEQRTVYGGTTSDSSDTPYSTSGSKSGSNPYSTSGSKSSSSRSSSYPSSGGYSGGK